MVAAQPLVSIDTPGEKRDSWTFSRNDRHQGALPSVPISCYAQWLMHDTGKWLSLTFAQMRYGISPSYTGHVSYLVCKENGYSL